MVLKHDYRKISRVPYDTLKLIHFHPIKMTAILLFWAITPLKLTILNFLNFFKPRQNTLGFGWSHFILGLGLKGLIKMITKAKVIIRIKESNENQITLSCQYPDHSSFFRNGIKSIQTKRKTKDFLNQIKSLQLNFNCTFCKILSQRHFTE